MTLPISHELAIALSESRVVTFVMESALLRWLKIPSRILFWIAPGKVRIRR